jgi:uracil phosphoribosyltransferase
MCEYFWTINTSSLRTQLLIIDYSKLPTQVNVDQVFLLDPLIATGGTVRAALNMINDWGYPGAHSISSALP